MTDAVVVELTWRDIHIAGGVAVSRAVNAIARGRRDRFGLTHDGNLGADMEWMGCIGEMAVSKFTNRFWAAGLEIDRVDATDYEVRTVGETRKRLILHPTDHDDLPYISAFVSRVRLPLVILRGFVLGRDGKRQEWWTDPGTGRPAFFVPTDRLLPMAEIPVARGQAA